MMRRFAVVLGLIAAVMLAACSSPAPSASGDAARGKQIFQTGGASGVPCATCHTLDGSALVGPTLQGISKTAASRVAGLSAEDYLKQSIDNPSAYMVEGFSDQMYKQYGDSLSKQELDDLVAFLMTQ
jgi:cytochrome c oxidase subunit 2